MRVAFTALTLGAASLTACAPSISPDTYSVGSVGTVNRAVEGVVISVREVVVDRNTGTGGAAGAGIGAAGGSALGSSTEGSIAGAIAGAVVGGIVGSGIEGANSKAKGYEYVIRTGNGALLTLVQGGEPILVDAPVIVVYGSPSRIIPNKRMPGS